MADGYKLFLRIEGLPKTINAIGRAHWRVKKKEADTWKEAVFLLTRGKLPPKPLLKAKITYVRVSTREPDHDGLVSTFKHVQDGLKAAGVLSDDKKTVTGVPTYIWQKGKIGHGYIMISVEAVPE